MKRNKKIAAALSLAAAAVLTASMTVCADTPETFQSKGAICFGHGNEGRVILDASDFDVLFQYAAEGKNAILHALGGIGTRQKQEGEANSYVREKNPAEAQTLQTPEELAQTDFAGLLQAAGDSQKIPQSCAESCTLATADNLTLGRAGCADGSLILGNNHDLIQSYLQGWRDARDGQLQQKELPEKTPVVGETHDELRRPLSGDNNVSLSSRGSICYQNQNESSSFSAQDFQELGSYLDGQKEEAARRLKQLGTVLLIEDGELVCSRMPGRDGKAAASSQLSWEILGEALCASQQIPSGIAVSDSGRALHIEDTGERTDDYDVSCADHISLGKGIWLDGNFVIGNGRDNDRAYQQGGEDEEDGRIPDAFLPIYRCEGASLRLEHTHQGKKQNKAGQSGCYKNWSTQEYSDECGYELLYAEPVWYPDETGDGGSWHGGYYYCRFHTSYTSDHAGVCRHKDKKTVWHHKTTCGITEEDSYAELTVQGEERDVKDAKLTLTANLTEGTLYDSLIWENGEKLLWYDEAGNQIGEGKEIQVAAEGVYTCRLGVSNEDISCKEVQVTVEVADLILRVESPEGYVLQTEKPEMEEAVTAEPEMDEPETEEQETEESETEELETDEPETEEQETDEPETEKPEMDEPETDEPETEKPETDEPESEQAENSPAAVSSHSMNKNTL